ncbi:MAG: AAA family ATPase, partial [Propionibacteriaceae bacterium]|nr:AAA family ATPase [Propionibacteriaceae bacterium]
LMGLLGDDDVEQIYQVVAGAIDRKAIDTQDLVAALEAPASRKQFQVFTGEEEIAEMLAQPLAQWRVYLHHTQRELAEKEVYNGPARVTGGAGTGKTVVALHRARFLADRLEDRTGKPVLFTTFTRNLAALIENDLRGLGGAEVLDVVEVMNVDALAHRIVRDAEGSSPALITKSQEILDLWQRSADETGCEHSPAFLNGEWEQV